MIEKKLALTQLFDYYGDLLTEKQREVLNLFLIEDFGHVEIGETLSISRQAVYDTIKTCDKQLHEFEEKLGLIQRSIERQKKLEALIADIDQLTRTLETSSQREACNQLVHALQEILAL